ncbi:hypothetical protein DAEQUDRAFT_814858, partial [Daedalea quercina L-15889]
MNITMVSPPATRRSCVRCNGTEHNPMKFLIECCRCQRVWHHSCHIPPIPEAEVLGRIEADENDRPAEGLGTWVCRRCSKRPTTNASEPVASTLTNAMKTAILSSNIPPERSSMPLQVNVQHDPTFNQGREGVQQKSSMREPQVVQISMVGPHRGATPQIDLLHPPSSPAKLATKVGTGRKQHEHAVIDLSTSDDPPHDRQKSEVLSPDTIPNRVSASTHSSLSVSSRSPTETPPQLRTPQGSLHVAAAVYTSTPASSSTSIGPDLPDIASSTTPRPSTPRIPWVKKGKERVPDFRAMVADLRAAGKLQDPTILQQISRYQGGMELEESDDIASTHPHASDRSTTRDTPDVDELYATPPPSSRSRSRYGTHDNDNMYATAELDKHQPRADTHDIDDMYGTPAPMPTPSRYDTHDIDDMYATPAAEIARPIVPGNSGEERVSRPPSAAEEVKTRLVFDWQNERFPDGEDEISAMLKRKMERVQLHKTGEEKKRPRKMAHTQRLGKGDRRRKEERTLTFYVPQ